MGSPKTRRAMSSRAHRPQPPLPSSPSTDLVGRLRRAFNAVRDAQEMTERLLRRGPATTHPKLRAVLDDLEWTGRELTTALREIAAPSPEEPPREA